MSDNAACIAPEAQDFAGRLRGYAGFLASNYTALSPDEAQILVRAFESAADHVAAYLSSARSETLHRLDPGTEKLLRDLLDRGYKMHVQAGSLRVAEQNPDHNDPLIAWLSDVRSVLYGNTKPEPRPL